DLSLRASEPTEMEVNGGDGSNTLIGPDRLTNWAVTAADEGTLKDAVGAGSKQTTITFKNVGNLVGGMDSDKFLVSSSVTGAIEGGGMPGLNTFQETAAGTTILTGRNSGTTGMVAAGFRDFAKIVDLADQPKTFVDHAGFLRGSGSIDGGGNA